MLLTAVELAVAFELGVGVADEAPALEELGILVVASVVAAGWLLTGAAGDVAVDG